MARGLLPPYKNVTKGFILSSPCVTYQTAGWPPAGTASQAEPRWFARSLRGLEEGPSISK